MRTCSKCGAKLTGVDREGICPRCFLQGGLTPTEGDSSLTIEATSPPAVIEQPGDCIGRYKLLEQIGEGGFGVVYMAEQREPVQRKVALKIIKAGMDTKEVIARFEAERQALAMMDHPNIARVVDAGTTEMGRPYFVMELVRGTRITEYCDEHSMSTAERLQLFIKVCHSVQHAHQKGIIHRDLKPSNVLVTLHDGEPVPKVIDFGVAKALGQKLTDKTLFTGFTQMIGTPAYMSPEQAEMSGLDIDNHLNHLPVTAASPTMRYRLAKFARRNRAGLATATAFSLLLVTGTVVSVWEAVRATQNADAADQQAARASKLAQEESLQRQRATTSALESRERLVRLNLANGNRLLDEGNHFGALTWFAEALSLDRDRPDKERTHRLRLTSVMKQSPKLLNMWFHGAAAGIAEFSKDGRYIVTASNDRTARIWDANTGQPVTPSLLHTAEVACACFSPDGSQLMTGTADGARLWKIPSGEVNLTLTHDQVEDATFSPDGRLVATASRLGTARVWDAATGKPVGLKLQHSPGPRAVQHNAVVKFSGDGQRVLTACYDQNVCVWEVRTGALLFTLPHSSGVRHAQFSPDGLIIATANWANTAHLWDGRTGQPLAPPLQHEGMVDHVAFSPDGKWMVSSCFDGLAKMWESHRGELVRTYNAGKYFVMSSTFSPDGSQLLLRRFTGQVQVWSALDNQPVSAPILLGDHPTSAEFHPDGRRILTACQDGSVRLWDIQTDRSLIWPWPNEVRAIVATSPRGARVATEDAAGLVQIWDTTQWQPKALAIACSNGVIQALFSSDEQRLLTVEWKKDEAGGDEAMLEFKTWDLIGGRLLHQARVPTTGSFSQKTVFSASPDCRQVAFGPDRILEAWDLTLGKMLWRSQSHATRLSVVRYSPDGRRLAINCGQKVHLFDAATGVEVCPALTNRLLVSWADFSPDGRLLVSTCSDETYENGEARIWVVATGELLRALEHNDGVKCAAFSSDGRLLATGGESMTARVFDVNTGQPLTPSMRLGEYIDSVAFSPDGRMLATGGHKHVARVWDVSTGEPITPPFSHSNKVDRVLFLAGGNYLATLSQDSWHLWDLRSSQQPIEDLMASARLLSGYRVDSTGVMEPLDARALSNLWNHLHVTWPENFTFFPGKRLPIPEGRLKTPLRLPAIPPRDAKAGPNLIDLGEFYNTSLTEDAHGIVGHNLAALPHGMQKLRETEFDIRGFIQLYGKDLASQGGVTFPVFVTGIPLNRKCAELHFLHGTGWSETNGMKIGAYVLHYADGQQSELPIIYGEDARNWWCCTPGDDQETTRARLAWTGENPAVKRFNAHVRLYHRTWENPRPDMEVKTIDFVSAKTQCAPFLIAITVE